MSWGQFNKKQYNNLQTGDLIWVKLYDDDKSPKLAFINSNAVGEPDSIMSIPESWSAEIRSLSEDGVLRAFPFEEDARRFGEVTHIFKHNDLVGEKGSKKKIHYMKYEYDELHFRKSYCGVYDHRGTGYKVSKNEDDVTCEKCLNYLN